MTVLLVIAISMAALFWFLVLYACVDAIFHFGGEWLKKKRV